MFLKMFLLFAWKRKIYLFAIVLAAAYFLYPGTPMVDMSLETSQPTITAQTFLPSVKNASVMNTILLDDLPGQWEYKTSHNKDGVLTMFYTKPGNHRITVIVEDMRTPELALESVTPEKFSYPQSNFDWDEPRETRYKNVNAMKGTFIQDGKVMGELISYPQDRYLVTAYIIGENDKVVDMGSILDSLEFPE